MDDDGYRYGDLNMTLAEAFMCWMAHRPNSYARDKAWFRYCDIRDRLPLGTTEDWIKKAGLLEPLRLTAPMV